MHVILNLPIWDVGVIGPVSPKSERVLSKPLRLGRVGGEGLCSSRQESPLRRAGPEARREPSTRLGEDGVG